ncbi:MAG TPA: RidA family protein [candidate division Zixibacteria bacterium]|nr:RidA family protein [candidate division Zixibacteria bacterium]
MPVTIVNPAQLVRPKGYNHGFKVPGGTNMLFLGGQVAWDKEGRLVGEGDVVRQFDKALENLLQVVREAGGQPEDIVKLNLYVTDKQSYLGSLQELGRVYRKHMGRHFPAMTLVEVKGLYEAGAMVEIEGVAVVPGEG